MTVKDFTALVQPFSGQAGTAVAPTYTALNTFTGMKFPNTGHEVVAIINGATGSNYTIDIGATVAGQPVTPIGPTACPTSNAAPVFLGPFPSSFNQPGTNFVEIDFTTPTTVTAAVLQHPGVS